MTTSFSLASVYAQLTSFANLSNFWSLFNTAFGSSYDSATAATLRSQWQSGNFSQFPKIEIVSSDVLGTANGAYASRSNTIYLSAQFLAIVSQESLSNLILEEFGHFVDAQVNSVDSAGDEGAIFAALVQGESLDLETLQVLRSEDDRGAIMVNGEVIQVEKQEFTGTNVNDSIIGGAVNDSLLGLDGDDSLLGLDGDDTLNGGAGIDTLIGGLGDDIYVVDSTTDVIIELANQEGKDTIQSSVTFSLASLTNIENLTLTGTTAINGTGDAGDNAILGNVANNILNGGAGKDYFWGDEGGDTLTGGEGDDTLNGGAGIDTLIGGLGDDIYIVDSTTDVITELAFQGTDMVRSAVSFTLELLANIENLRLEGMGEINGTGNAGDNAILGNAAKNILNGGAGKDYFWGDEGGDTLNGGEGDDTLNGGAGKDFLTGDSGGDRFVYVKMTDYLTVTDSLTDSLLANFDKISDFNANANNDLFLLRTARTGFQNAGVVAALDNAAITAKLTAANFGANSAASFTLVSGETFVAINDATAGFNQATDAIIEVTGLTGTLGLGNFVVLGLGNLVQFTGTNGNDIIIGGVGNEILLGLDGNDELNGATGNDSIIGGAGNDTLLGLDGRDTLNGGEGDDTLNGGAGIDTLIGGLGNDIYIVDSTTDVITELALQGTDMVRSYVSFTLELLANIENLRLEGMGAINGTGDAGDNAILGNVANNILNGGAGKDYLWGDKGNDTLNGGEGNDTLNGGAGKDFLTGDSGGDYFVYRTLADSPLANFDEITDFNATTDRFLVTTPSSGFNNVGTVTSLDNAGISTILTPVNFGANSAASFTFGTRTFVAINDATAGFSQTTDAIIEITGLTGTLGLTNFVTV